MCPICLPHIVRCNQHNNYTFLSNHRSSLLHMGMHGALPFGSFHTCMCRDVSPSEPLFEALPFASPLACMLSHRTYLLPSFSQFFVCWRCPGCYFINSLTRSFFAFSIICKYSRFFSRSLFSSFFDTCLFPASFSMLEWFDPAKHILLVRSRRMRFSISLIEVNI